MLFVLHKIKFCLQRLQKGCGKKVGAISWTKNLQLTCQLVHLTHDLPRALSGGAAMVVAFMPLTALLWLPVCFYKTDGRTPELGSKYTGEMYRSASACRPSQVPHSLLLKVL